MSRYLKIVIAIILFIIPVSIFAEKINIPNTSIVDITIPENWQLITSNNLNEMIDWLGLDSLEKVKYKYNWNNNFYRADIVKESKEINIVLTVKESNIDYEDISLYMYDLEDIENQIRKSYSNETDISLYKTANGIKYYIVFYVNDNNKNVIDCLTTIHGNMYTYTIESDNVITEDVISDLMGIISSVEYENYLEFIEANKIELTEEKQDISGIIIFIVILLVIVIAGAVIYILLNKKKKAKRQVSQLQTYNPVPTSSTSLNDLGSVETSVNPAVADFLNQENNKK